MLAKEDTAHPPGAAMAWYGAACGAALWDLPPLGLVALSTCLIPAYPAARTAF